LRRRPSAIKRSWYRLTGRNPYAPKQEKTSGEKLTFQDIRNNYKAYRKDRRVYLAQKKFFKQKEKERRQKERRNNHDNPFHQILLAMNGRGRLQ